MTKSSTAVSLPAVAAAGTRYGTIGCLPSISTAALAPLVAVWRSSKVAPFHSLACCCPNNWR